MPNPTPGLHHVTAISGPPARNVGFYTGDLGLKLVKRTVNFDDPGTWHLYYGDAAGSPGTILTFFPFAHAAPGRAGHGGALAFAYITAPGSLEGWATALGNGPDALSDRFGARVLSLRDPHGQRVELIEDSSAPAEGVGAFHSVTLWVADPAATVRVLTDHLGYAETGTERQGDAERIRLTATVGGPAAIVDVLRQPGAQARSGAGSIHHIAFRATDNAHQDELREALMAVGHRVTPRIDRQYFNAIYFREPGGVLFEIATDPPGFAVDEAPATLGTALKLPPQYEPHRARIEAALPPLETAAR